LLSLVLCIILAGLGCLIISPIELMLPAVLLVGLGIGALFPLQLIVTLDHARTPSEAGALLAFVQGGGYTIAALIPLRGGRIRAPTACLEWGWVCLLCGMLLVLLMTWKLKQPAAQQTIEGAAGAGR